MEKKGYGAFLIWTILTIIGLIILFLSLSNFGFLSSSTIDKQACKESVILRNTFNVGTLVESGRNKIKLQCKTEDICITNSNEKCEDVLEDVETIIKVKDKEIKEKIIDIAANASIDCHYMLGRGFLDFMPTRTFSDNYCIICSRIAFDKETYEVAKDISQQEFYYYLSTKMTNEGKSYLEELYKIKNPYYVSLFYDGVLNFQPTDNEEKVQFEQFRENFGEKRFEDLKLFTHEDNVVIVQMQTPGRVGQILLTGTSAGLIVTTGTLAIAGAISGVGFFAAIPLAAGIISSYGSAGVVFSSLVYYLTTPSGNVYVPPIILPYDSNNLEMVNALKCTSFESAP